MSKFPREDYLKSNGSNWTVFKIRFLAYLSSYFFAAWLAVTGEVVAPVDGEEPVAPDHQEAISQVLLCFESDFLPVIQEQRFADGGVLWRWIDARFTSTSKSKRDTYYEKINERFDGPFMSFDVGKYFDDKVSYRRQYNDHAEPCQSFPDDTLIGAVLDGLPRQFEGTHNYLRLQERYPSLVVVRDMLVRAGERLKKVARDDAAAVAAAAAAEAAYAAAQASGRGGGRGGGYNGGRGWHGGGRGDWHNDWHGGGHDGGRGGWRGGGHGGGRHPYGGRGAMLQPDGGVAKPGRGDGGGRGRGRGRGGRGAGRGDAGRGHAAAAEEPELCWKCYQPGHIKKDCPLYKAAKVAAATAAAVQLAGSVCVTFVSPAAGRSEPPDSQRQRDSF
jgi:hypothetical protein